MLKGAILNNMDVGSKLFFEEKFSNLEVITAKSDEQLSSLIRLQAADGHFNCGGALSNCIGRNQSACPCYVEIIKLLAIVVLD